MKFQNQSVKHDPPNSYGDCFRTTIANLLGLDAVDVPHFLDQDRQWPEALAMVNEFLRPYGLCFMMLNIRESEVRNSFGYSGLHYEGGGDTCRGTVHSSVFCDGKLVHDPHPSHAGFTSVHDCMGIFVALRPWEIVARKAVSR
jgi:hypothetical protein